MAQSFIFEEQGSPPGALRRLGVLLCLLAALLFVHWSALSSDWIIARDFGAILNGAGTIDGDEKVSPPAVPLQGVFRANAGKARSLGQLHEPASAHASAWGVVSESPATVTDLVSVPAPLAAPQVTAVRLAARVRPRAPPVSI